MSEIILTEKLINDGLTLGVGIQQRQADVLGIKTKKGWKKCLIGKKYPKDIYELFLAMKDKNYIPTFQDNYTILLQRKEWKAKREVILKRDGHRCSKCQSDKNLQVHHLYYYKDKIMPWMYPHDCYITLCGKCHSEWHEKNNIVIKKRPKSKEKKIINKQQYNIGHFQEFFSFLLKENYLNSRAYQQRKTIIKDFIRIKQQ